MPIFKKGVSTTATNTEYDEYGKPKKSGVSTTATATAVPATTQIAGQPAQQETLTPDPAPTTSATPNTGNANTYTSTDYNNALSIAQGTPTTYQSYDYSGLQDKANQTPATYSAYDYSKSSNIADANSQKQVSSLGSEVSLADVNDQINKAANTLSTADYQSPEYVATAAQSIYESLKPILSQQNAATNQQYNTSAQKLAEQLAATGANRGGTNTRQTMALEQNRNTALADNSNNMLSQALTQAIEQGTLGLSEKSLLQSQQQTAAEQLANLLATQEASRQWAEGTNLDTAQNYFNNALAAQAAQAGEGQFTFNVNADQQQQQFSNLMDVANAVAADSQYGQNFNANQQQQQFANLMDVLGAQSGENQFAANYGLSGQQLAQALAIAQMQNDTSRYGIDTNATVNREQLAAQVAQWAAQNGLQQAELTGQMTTPVDYSSMTTSQLADAFSKLPSSLQNAFNSSNAVDQYAALRNSGDQEGANNILRSWLSQNAPTTSTQTLAAQQYANSIDPNSLANQLAIAQLTGQYGGQDTLAARQLSQSQQQALNTQVTAMLASWLENTQNAALPAGVTEWINSMLNREQ